MLYLLAATAGSRHGNKHRHPYKIFDRGSQQRAVGTTLKICDVVVIGSGFAGLSAAIEASDALLRLRGAEGNGDGGLGLGLGGGGRVLVVEKMPVPGGNSVMNAGQIAAVGSEAQRLAGIDDSVELMMEDMARAGGDLNHPLLLETMIRGSNDVVLWTQDELGIEYRDRVTQLGGHSVPRTLSTLNACGNDIIHPMLDAIKKRTNVELLLNTAFERFVTTTDDRGGGEPGVRGILAKDGVTGKEMTIVCRRGVVVASGGFSADVPFRSTQNPSLDNSVMTTNQPGATGEVLKEAIKIGAMPVQLSRIQLGPWTSPDEDGFGKAPFFCLGAGFPYGIIVDPLTSKRFVNELGNRYDRSASILKLGHPAVCIVDSDGARHSLRGDLEELRPAVKSFESLRALCEEYGMDPTVLRETVQAYNRGVADKRDEFGKALRDDLEPIRTPPFYGVRLWPKVHHTMGGLHINERAQVMSLDGRPIDGLYAAGEVAGGVHGGDRLGSCATLDCIAFGRIAGRTAATAEASVVVPR